MMTSVTAPADRRFRRAHLKPARRRSGWSFLRARTVLTIAAVGLACFSAQRSMSTITALDVFRIDRITVRGNKRLSTGEVQALLQRLGGHSILSIDLDEWRAALLNSPWVEDASLRRTLPSTVEVTVAERTPLGIGRINGTLYLVDDRGVVIDEYGPVYADLDLPILDGLSAIRGDETTNMYRAALARRLLDAVRDRGLSARISQIDISDARNAVVLLDGDPTLLRLGSERFVERLQSYLELAAALHEQVPVIDYVDLRFDERVYVRPAQPGGSRGARARPVKRGKEIQTG
jgi:cell division protein FtsQ